MISILDSTAQGGYTDSNSHTDSDPRIVIPTTTKFAEVTRLGSDSAKLFPKITTGIISITSRPTKWMNKCLSNNLESANRNIGSIQHIMDKTAEEGSVAMLGTAILYADDFNPRYFSYLNSTIVAQTRLSIMKSGDVPAGKHREVSEARAVVVIPAFDIEHESQWAAEATSEIWNTSISITLFSVLSETGADAYIIKSLV